MSKIKVTAKVTPKNVYAFIQGNVRYKIWYKYKWLRWLVPDHVWQQIRFRLAVMDRECLAMGQCKVCGCKTTALQFANKRCDGWCYPPMMSRSKWDLFIRNGYAIVNDDLHQYKEQKVNGSDSVRFLYYINGIEVNRIILDKSVKELIGLKDIYKKRHKEY